MLYCCHDLEKAGFIFINKTSVLLHSYASRYIYFMFMPLKTINRWVKQKHSVFYNMRQQLKYIWNRPRSKKGSESNANNERLSAVAVQAVVLNLRQFHITPVFKRPWRCQTFLSSNVWNRRVWLWDLNVGNFYLNVSLFEKVEPPCLSFLPL